ncbi:NAD(P)-dependent oxidoreductase [Nocardia pseudovaccinii]|uniref:NAD(P)-dependent oxidoreductase n=1 Tax=Nocardia pseudovaccinii TaxID=189540 RepID=UPI000A859DE5|nr:NAD(P)-dependent oxidoreductase [Nocardia pseudovaccinii]
MLEEATLDSPDVLVVDDGFLTATWPYLGDRLRSGLADGGFTVMWKRLRAGRHLRDIPGIAEVAALVVLGVEPEPADIAAMPRLAVVAGVTGTSLAVAPQLAARSIPHVDGARGHSHSQAEMAIALTLSALRQLPSWHIKMAVEGPRAWPLPSWQFSDHPGYVNGTLRGKRVSVIGLDPVGTHVAHLCVAFGASVSAIDPDADDVEFSPCGIERIGLEQVAQATDILVVASGSRRSHVSAELVDRLTLGSLVVTVDAAGIDLAALRARVLRDELMWATDVFETTPVDLDDPILSRDNVIHTPGVAGRTRDANYGVADVLVENVIRALHGVPPWPWDRISAAADTTSDDAATRGRSAFETEVVSLTEIGHAIGAGRW